MYLEVMIAKEDEDVIKTDTCKSLVNESSHALRVLITY